MAALNYKKNATYFVRRSADIEGRALVATVSVWAGDKGASGVSLQVAAANDRARKFYDELGFREISVYEVLEF